MNLDVVETKKFYFADGHIFKTINGEGAMLGVTNLFFRLAGCSVGCKGCDTRYNHNKIELSIEEILERIFTEENKGVEWIWITGGEPSDQDLWLLIKEIKKYCTKQKFAVATSGIRAMSQVAFDFISVSPHGKPNDLRIHRGDQINLVPSLGGLCLDDWVDYNFSGFQHKWITPAYSNDRDSMNESLCECIKWIDANPDFKLGIQAHKIWGIK